MSWESMPAVETILEVEEADRELDYASSASPHSLSSLISPLRSTVKAWSLARGRKPDALVHVQDLCFHLHKDVLSSSSRYLKRQLTAAPEVNVSPPLNITAETFAAVARFSYVNDVSLTPFNVAALRTAAELLEMTEGHGGDSLAELSEAYFRRAVSVNQEHASIVLGACLRLLPEAEETAALASRCIEAMSMLEDGGDGVTDGLDDLTVLRAEDFQTIADSMHHRFVQNHDLLYGVVDLYLKEQQPGNVTEEQIIRICNTIDCNKLSPQFLTHAVQNPRMPLRFVVRAMLVEQLNTRRSIYAAAAESTPRGQRGRNHHHDQHSPRPPPIMQQRQLLKEEASTLGAIIQRDAALRQVSELKAAMDATCSRIQTLESNLTGMKQLLHESETRRSALESRRSESFRVTATTNKVQRGERGSVSAASIRFNANRDRVEGGSSSTTGSGNGASSRFDADRDRVRGGPPSTHGKANNNNNNNNVIRSEKNKGGGSGWRLFKGFKGAFRHLNLKREGDGGRRKNHGKLNRVIEETFYVDDDEYDHDLEIYGNGR